MFWNHISFSIRICLLSLFIHVMQDIFFCTQGTDPAYIRLIAPFTFLVYSSAHYFLCFLKKRITPFHRVDLLSYSLLPLFVLIGFVYSSSGFHTFFPYAYLALLIGKFYNLFLDFIPCFRKVGSKSINSVAVFVFFFLSCAPFALINLKTTQLQGDEPYFLLITSSIINDGDIDLENNYLNGDSLNFTENRLSPQLWDRYTDNHLYSRHSTLLPLLLVPGFFIFGRAGALLILHIMSCILGILILQTVFLVTRSFRSAVVTATIFLTTAPIFLYSHRFYTELPGAILTMLLLINCLNDTIKTRVGFVLSAIITFVAFWLKTRFLAICIPLLVVYLLLSKISPTKLIKRSALVVLILSIIALTNRIIYGKIFVRYELADLCGTNLLRILRGILGQMWDAQYGLIFMNPVMIFAFLGIGLLLNKRISNHRTAIIWITAVVPYFLVVSAYAELIGGICPRGRFLVGWITFLSIPFGLSIKYLRSKLYCSTFRMLLWTSWTLIVLMIIQPSWQIDLPGRSNHILTSFSLALNQDFLGLLPSFDRPHLQSWVSGMILTITLLASIAIARKTSYFRSVQIRNTGTTAILPALVICCCLPVANKLAESGWMEVEDRTFISSTAQAFWEEPYKWDRPFSTTWPYIAGLTLNPGDSIERRIPLRGHGNVLEILVKGNPGNGTLPILKVSANSGNACYQTIHSDSFQSVKIPVAPLQTGPSDGLILSTYQLEEESKPATIEIDKIRLIQDSAPACLSTPPPSVNPLPVCFENLCIRSIRLPDHTISQSQSFPVELSVDGPAQNSNLQIKGRIRQNLLVQDIEFYPLTHSVLRGVFPADEARGAGQFEVQLQVTDNNAPLKIASNSGFQRHDWVYAGDVYLKPELRNSASEDQKCLKNLVGEHIQILPYALTLSSSESITMHLNIQQPISGIAFISNLTGIFQIIPFESQIGTLSVITDASTVNSPLVIGRHTAEDLLEFPGFDINLPHKHPPIAAQRIQSLTFPPQFVGIQYTSLKYLSTVSLPEKTPIDSLDITVNNLPGAFNIYAIGLLD